MRWKKKSEKFSLSQNFKLHLTFSGDNTEALVISKRLKLPQDDRTDINFLVLIRMYSKVLKVLWISYKKCFQSFQEETVVGCPCLIVSIVSTFIDFIDFYVDATENLRKSEIFWLGQTCAKLYTLLTLISTRV